MESPTNGGGLGNDPTARRQSNTLLLTGCTGFIGAHVTRELLGQGYIVYAIVRDRNKLLKLVGEVCPDNLVILEGDLLVNTDLHKLQEELAQLGDFDVVIHMIGGGPLTSNHKFSMDIFNLNYMTTHNLVLLLECGRKLDHLSLFVYFSSLAAMGVPCSQGDTILYTATSSCEPLLPYEQAKLQTEEFLREVTRKHNFRTVVFRFPQVYGGKDDQFAHMIRLIRRGVFPVVRNRVGTLPLLHVSDAARATCLVVKKYDLLQGKYDVNLISENSYSYDDLKALVTRRYGSGRVLKLPYAFLYSAILVIESVFRVIGKPEPLNRRRLISMTKARVVDCEKFLQTFGFQFDHDVATFMADNLA
jgi:nucleoside-diphosphate-sugar epimerase